MALEDIRKRFVIKAIEEFENIGPDKMLTSDGGRQSTKWYILYNGKYYDQKLICRAAHRLQRLGRLPVNSFKAYGARRKLKELGFNVKKKNA